jgi:hypothetical protein
MDVDVVLGRGQQQGRAGNLAAGGAVSLLMSSIDAQTSSIVLAHSVHDLRIGQCSPDVGVILFSHFGRRWRLVPGVGIRVDDSLGGLVRLAEKSPVPPCPDEGFVDALNMLDDRKTVHDHELLDDVRMIHGGAKGDDRTRSWPTTAKRSRPRCRMSATMSPASARFEDCACSGASGGTVDRP